MQDDLIDLPSLQHRRNALLTEYAAVIEQSAPDDRYTYEIARAALSGPGKDVYFAALHASGNGSGVDRASSVSHAAGAPNG